RFSEGQYQRAFRDYLMLKYGGIRFDLVVAMQDAIQFVIKYRGELFPEIPVVYHTVSRPTAVLANSTGVVEVRDFGHTLAFAEALQPDLNQVFVISGKGGREKVLEELARAQFRSFESRLTITYLTGLTTAELERRLAALPPRSMVFYLIVYQTGDGENVNPIEYLE